MPRGHGTRGGGKRQYAITFAGDQNPLSDGGQWLGGLSVGLDWTDPQVLSGICCPTQADHALPPYDDSVAVLAGPWRADQSASAVLSRTSPSGEHECELYLRMAVAAHSVRGYEVTVTQGGGLYVVRWNGALNDFTQLLNYGSIGTPVTGTVLAARIIGKNLTVSVNGSEVTTLDVTSGAGSSGDYWSDGAPGLGFWYHSASDAKNTFGMTSYAAAEW